MAKKEKIIEAAVKIFQEKGIEKAKVSDIVKLAGIAQGTFYLYFPSKLSVMPAIAEVMVEKMMIEVKSEVDKDTSISAQLSQVVEAIFRTTKNYWEVMALIYAGLTSTEHMKKWEMLYEPFYSWMSLFLQKAKAAGKIRETVKPEQTSKLMIAFIEAAAEQVYLYDAVTDEEVELQKSELHSLLKHALGVEE